MCASSIVLNGTDFTINKRSPLTDKIKSAER